MNPEKARGKRRAWVVVNYMCLLIMNVCFYFVSQDPDMTHWVDVVGIAALVVVVVSFIYAHTKTGLWKLVHAKTDVLDERELQITHSALGYSYGWFTVICLLILMAHAVLYRLVPDVNLVITVPLVGSLIYLAHTLPGSILAWREAEVPGDAK